MVLIIVAVDTVVIKLYLLMIDYGANRRNIQTSIVSLNRVRSRGRFHPYILYLRQCQNLYEDTTRASTEQTCLIVFILLVVHIYESGN